MRGFQHTDPNPPTHHARTYHSTHRSHTDVKDSQLMLEEASSMGCSARRILAVGAAAADPYSCWWRWRCCCCCVPAKLGADELSNARLGAKRKHWHCLSMDGNVRAVQVYSKVKPRFFRPAGCFRAGFARPILASLGTAGGESPGDPPPESPRRRPVAGPARSQSRKNRVCFAGDPSGFVVPGRPREPRSARQSFSEKTASLNTTQFPYDK